MAIASTPGTPMAMLASATVPSSRPRPARTSARPTRRRPLRASQSPTFRGHDDRDGGQQQPERDGHDPGVLREDAARDEQEAGRGAPGRAYAHHPAGRRRPSAGDEERGRGAEEGEDPDPEGRRTRLAAPRQRVRPVPAYSPRAAFMSASAAPSTPPAKSPFLNAGTTTPLVICFARASGMGTLEPVADLDPHLAVVDERKEDDAVVLVLLSRHFHARNAAFANSSSVVSAGSLRST